jgi:hypothetical protein
MGRWAQANKRGTVGPGSTVSEPFLSAPDESGFTFNEISFGGNTTWSMEGYTFGFPAGVWVAWEAGVVSNVYTIFGNGNPATLPHDVATVAGEETPIFLRFKWVDPGGSPDRSPWSNEVEWSV